MNVYIPAHALPTWQITLRCILFKEMDRNVGQPFALSAAARLPPSSRPRTFIRHLAFLFIYAANALWSGAANTDLRVMVGPR